MLAQRVDNSQLAADEGKEGMTPRANLLTAKVVFH
jgi:hypothetical protein